MQVAGVQYKAPVLGVPAKLAQLYTHLQNVCFKFLAQGPGLVEFCLSKLTFYLWCSRWSLARVA